MRLPLTGDEGSILSYLVFYRDIRHSAPAVDIGHLCGNPQANWARLSPG